MTAYSNKELQNSHFFKYSKQVKFCNVHIGAGWFKAFKSLLNFFFFNPYENNEWRNISRTKATKKVIGRCCALFSQLAKVVV